jgi:6-phosphogluconolactonase
MTSTLTCLYVAHQDGREIRVYRMDAATGALTALQTVACNGAVMPMAVSPDRRHLYAALRTKPFAIASFSIDAASGLLTHLADTPAPDSMPYISTDRSGRFLFGVTNPESRTKPRNSVLSVFPINAQGVVQAAQQIVPAREKAHAVLATTANRHVFASSCDGDVMLRWAFDAAAGTVSSEGVIAARVKDRAGPRHFAFHPDQRFMVLVNEYDGTLITYAHDAASGALKEIQLSEIVARDPGGKSTRAADLHFTPDGRWLYASERLSGTLTAFRVDADNGLLTRSGNFATEKEPRGFAIDPQGRFLFAAGRLSNNMTTYAIDADSGALTALHRQAMGNGPNWIEIVTLR